ncbi:MAG: mitochondrial ATPase complex subunit ATP10 [Microscillaceae bacterium]|nr:mitochondrial ATPase complex subunit ATP10 [Microscillaceae bacterium]MDW8460964.1 hypothetical protein [Cytophagales bacterium]
MQLKTQFLALVLMLANIVQAQVVGKMFPALSGENLLDKSVSLPQAGKGKVTLIGIAYSAKSDEALQTWRQPLFNLFIKAPGTDLFQFEPYDANLYFVAMVTGINRVASGKIETKLKEKAEERWKPYIILYRGSLEPYSEELGLKNKDLPYFFLLDKNGKIVYTTSGTYTASKQRELEDKLTEMLGDNQFQNKK